MELLAKVVNEWKALTIFGKSSILDVLQASEYASAEEIILLPTQQETVCLYGSVRLISVKSV